MTAAWLAALVIWLPAPAPGATLSIEVAPGFGGRVVLQHWNPVTVTLRNRGGAVRGTLEVVVTSGSEYLGDIYRSVHAQQVVLPYQSTRRCAATVRIQSAAHDLLVRYRDGERILASRSVDLRSRASTQGVIVLLDDAAAPDFLSALPADAPAFQVPPAHLPETWYGYGSVRLLIVNPDRLDRLGERQFHALVQWLHRGGRVLTFGGANVGALRQERSQRLLPARIQGHRRADTIDGFTDFCGQALSGTAPFLVLHADIADAEALVRLDRTPILTRRPTGRGQILFLALDPRTAPFSGWDGRSRFWERVLALPAPPAQPVPGLDPTEVLTSLAAPRRPRFPSAKAAILLVAVYLPVLGVLVLRAGRHARQRRGIVASLLATVALTTAAAAAIAHRPPGVHRLTVSRFSQLRIDGATGAAAGDHIIGLHSLRGSPYTVRCETADDPLTPLRLPAAGAFAPDHHVQWDTASGRQIHGRLPRWSQRFFNLTWQGRVPLTGTAARTAEGLEITVTNGLPETVAGVLAYHAGHLFPLGDIAPLTTVAAGRSRSGLAAMAPITASRINRLLRRTTAAHDGSLRMRLATGALSDWLMARHAASHGDHGHLHLIGWLPSALPGIRVSPSDGAGEALTLVHCRIPLERIGQRPGAGIADGHPSPPGGAGRQ